MKGSPLCHRCGHPNNEHHRRTRRCARCECNAYTEDLRKDSK